MVQALSSRVSPADTHTHHDTSLLALQQVHDALVYGSALGECMNSAQCYFATQQKPQVGDIVECFSDLCGSIHFGDKNLKVIQVDESYNVRIEGHRSWYRPKHFALPS